MERLQLRPPPNPSHLRNTERMSRRPGNVVDTVIHHKQPKGGGVYETRGKGALWDPLFQVAFVVDEVERKKNCRVTIGLSKSGKTEDGTENDYTVSISMVNW